MTKQIGELFYYKGNKYISGSVPFNIYLEQKGIRTIRINTSFWRGYSGKWEIKDNKLFLIAMDAGIIKEGDDRDESDIRRSEDYLIVDLDYFFPGQKEVFADWFSGNIALPCGELWWDSDFHWRVEHEQDLILEFKNGILINKSIHKNRDQLHYDGVYYSIETEPFYEYLEEYLEKNNINTSPYDYCNTYYGRIYHGEWEIKDNKLFLVTLSADILKKDILKIGEEHFSNADTDEGFDDVTVDLNYFFPDQKEVFADWFSGTIRIPLGKVLVPYHHGHFSLFEQDLFLDFKNGILINKRLVDNRPPMKGNDIDSNESSGS